MRFSNVAQISSATDLSKLLHRICWNGLMWRHGRFMAFEIRLYGGYQNCGRSKVPDGTLSGEWQGKGAKLDRARVLLIARHQESNDRFILMAQTSKLSRRHWD